MYCWKILRFSCFEDGGIRLGGDCAGMRKNGTHQEGDRILDILAVGLDGGFFAGLVREPAGIGSRAGLLVEMVHEDGAVPGPAGLFPQEEGGVVVGKGLSGHGHDTLEGGCWAGLK